MDYMCKGILIEFEKKKPDNEHLEDYVRMLPGVRKEGKEDEQSAADS